METSKGEIYDKADHGDDFDESDHDDDSDVIGPVLGFLRDIAANEEWRLESRYFNSKAGGRPPWLHLSSLPSQQEMECRKCSNPMVFLCQLYAPVSSESTDLSERTFHRSLFVFLCRDPRCHDKNDSSPFKVFRSQLTRKNEFYAFDPLNDEDPEARKLSTSATADHVTTLCRVCGNFGPLCCGKCKKVYYCSKLHQRMDWKLPEGAGHKEECQRSNVQGTPSQAAQKILFPVKEIIIDSSGKSDVESDEESSDEEENEEENQVKKALENGITETELSQFTGEQDTDGTFLKFKEIISKAPTQVIRYDRGGEPLNITDQKNERVVKPCENCGSRRCFEFQIMPQMLTGLNFDVSLGEKDIDWGVLLVYTCQESCDPPKGKGYVEEEIVKQDIME